MAKPLLVVILHDACLFLAAYATPPYHEVVITTDPPDGPYPLDTTVILTCSVTPPPPEEAIYSWTDSIPSTTLSSAQPNLTLTIPAHHPSQGHYYCTVYNGSLVLGVGSTTIRVRGELVYTSSLLLALSMIVLKQARMPLYQTVKELHSGVWCTNHTEEAS